MSKSPVRSICLLALLAGLISFSCDEANLNPGDPEIRVSPEVIHFRTLNLRETETGEITVENIGTAPLKISSISFDGTGAFGFDSFGDDSFPGVVFPNGIPQPGGSLPSSKTLTVIFEPEAFGIYAGNVVIESDALLHPAVLIPVDGFCSVADIQVSPTLLDFGRVGVDSSASLRLTVKNLGEADLYVPADEIQLLLGGTDSPFIWLAQDMALEAGQEDQIEVNYAPKEVPIDPDTHLVVPHQDSLLISSNDPDDNPVEVELKGEVAANLPPLAAVKIEKVTRLDGSLLDQPCEVAPSDTVTFKGRVLDPEGDHLHGSNLIWAVEQAPSGSIRRVRDSDDDEFAVTFIPDLSGEYTVCLKATDPQGNQRDYDPDAACDCPVAQAVPDEDFDCPCIHFTAYPREDIRVELTWDRIGPDMDLHLVAPGGEYCTRTRDCRFDPDDITNPDWSRTACVDNGSTRACLTPNCDPADAGCQVGQECYDNGSGSGPACYWQRCSGTDCFWDGRNPDWGILGEEKDDPLLAIDCTSSCRAENINLNDPVPGSFTIMVNTYTYSGDTEATIRVYFKGDVEPSAVFTGMMTSPDPECFDTWTVATIDWVDQENHPVTMINTHSCLECP